MGKQVNVSPQSLTPFPLLRPFPGLRDEEAAKYFYKDGYRGNFTYKCRACDFVGKDRGHVIKHVRRHHINEPVFKCGDCHKAFTVEDNLQKHYFKLHKVKLTLKEIRRRMAQAEKTDKAALSEFDDL